MVYFWGLLLFCMPMALLLEVIFPVPLAGYWVHLPWTSALVVYYALHQKLFVACCAALLGGVLVDGFSLGQPGPALLLYGAIVYLADRFKRQIVPEAPITAAVFGIATCVGGPILRLGVLWSDGHQGLSPLRIGAKLLFAFIAGGILTPLVCILMQALHRGLDLVPDEEGQHVNA